MSHHYRINWLLNTKEGSVLLGLLFITDILTLWPFTAHAIFTGNFPPLYFLLPAALTILVAGLSITFSREYDDLRITLCLFGLPIKCYWDGHVPGLTFNGIESWPARLKGEHVLTIDCHKLGVHVSGSEHRVLMNVVSINDALQMRRQRVVCL